jgi:hypothetical protein
VRRLSGGVRSLWRRVRRAGAPAADIDDRELAEVRVEYAPCRDGDPDPGEVVWTWVPWEEDPTQGKDRPVVVIGRHGDRLAAVALTSKHRDGDDQVPVGTGPWDREGRPSYAKLDRLLDVDADQVRREGGAISRDRFEALVAALRAHANVVAAPRRDR